MFIVFGPGGARLCGPGYIKNLSGEEYDLLTKVPGMQVVSVDQRAFDVAGAACMQGDNSVWEEQVASKVNPDNTLQAQEMLAYIDQHTS
jgi:hypothetical protein